MALTSTNTTQSAGLVSRLGGFGTSILNMLVRIAESSVMARAAEVRAQQIEVLNAKSDTELASMNLRRDEIAAYVFRDLMYV